MHYLAIHPGKYILKRHQENYKLIKCPIQRQRKLVSAAHFWTKLPYCFPPQSGCWKLWLITWLVLYTSLVLVQTLFKVLHHRVYCYGVVRRMPTTSKKIVKLHIFFFHAYFFPSLYVICLPG